MPLGEGQEPLAPSGFYVRMKDRPAKDEAPPKQNGKAPEAAEQKDETAQEQNGKAPEAAEQQAFTADDDLPF